uniref:NAC transcription factor 84 n=1 Tax=Litchi chinensis TaxID=151069 RepID=A0A8K1HZQ4_LITCN|nr:NAC transcription factor 84 [Litchi chinensis]
METNPSINSSSSSSININNASKPDQKPKILSHHHHIPIEDEYWKKFPVGYRFCPRDEELLVHYLRKKVLNHPLPPNKIAEVNIYNHNPEDLAEFYKAYKEDDVYYFFTPTDRKYPNGDRPSRAAGSGYWKATGAKKPVNYHGETVGYRNALVFYRGKPPNGAKTDWIMHEFKVDDKFRAQNPPPTRDVSCMRLDDWVLCKIYHKPGRSFKARNAEESHQHHDNNTCKARFGRSFKARNMEEDHQHHDNNTYKAHQNEPTTVMASTPSPQLNLPNDGDIMVHDQNQEINNNKIMESGSKLPFQDDPIWNNYINQENYYINQESFGYQESFGLHMGWIDNANNYNNPYL